MSTITTTVLRDGRIEIHAPEFAEGQVVDVVIQSRPEHDRNRSVFEILADYPGHVMFESAEEVDAYIRTERDSWER